MFINKQSTLLILLFVFVYNLSLGQSQEISGQLIDIDTKEGIATATVVISPTNGVVTDPDGNFSISAEKYPLELTVSHISYGVQTFTLSYQPKGKIVFRLEKVITDIPEILVSGKCLQVLTNGADYSVFNFEFDQKHMWFIGMLDNRPNKTRLFMAGLIGDTISSIPVSLPITFKKDVFGNVHLETIDSIFQLVEVKGKIELLYGERRDVYFRIMKGYQCTLGKGLVHFLSYSNLQESYVYYIDSTMAKAEPILIIKDEPDDYSWLPASLRQMGDILGARTLQLILDQQRSYFRELQSESIFKLKDSLYVTDLSNDKLLTIGPNQQLIRSVPISFHHQSKPTLTNLFKNFHDIITDPLSNHAYVVFHKNNNWRFFPLNPITGKTGSQIVLPRYNAMSNIRIHGGAVYFIYPEKIYPFFQRIYRKSIH
ncbi:MAG: carboxypeptidase-like regulatory domain-containing protein [Bacteroidota bacterium]|nr:carboxypeptidase-like regulatory domain-containing protein [Bacteroidota bacterium]